MVKIGSTVWVAHPNVSLIPMQSFIEGAIAPNLDLYSSSHKV
jgi:hypothetical protein